MKLISHRGNIDGKTLLENQPSYIDDAIELGYDVEVDIWYIGDRLYLGHDLAQYQIDIHWLENRKSKLWIHCKNHPALELMYQTDLHYFWHDEDDVTITSKGIIWAHPKIKPLEKSIAVLPENHNWPVGDCLGVCSDYIKQYKNEN
jgi:hypothetical protein